MTDLDSTYWKLDKSKEQIRAEGEDIKMVTEGSSSELLSNINITFDQAKQEYLRHEKAWRPLPAQAYLLKMVNIAQSDEDKEMVQQIEEHLLNEFNESYQEYLRHINGWRKEQAWPFIQKILDTMIFVKSKEEQKELMNKVRDLWFKD